MSSFIKEKINTSLWYFKCVWKNNIQIRQTKLMYLKKIKIKDNK